MVLDALGKTTHESWVGRSDASFMETVKLEISSAIREVAENALKLGLAFEVVAQITGLSVEGVEKIAEGMKGK